MSQLCHDDARDPECPADCEGPCCVTEAPTTRLSAPASLDVAELVALVGDAAGWTPQRAVVELDRLRVRAVRWRRWRGLGEPAEGVLVQTPRWSAFYIPVAVVVRLPELPAFVPEPGDDPIPF